MGRKTYNIDEKLKRIVEILKKHGAIKIEIFGSYARGEATSESDIDLIVDFENRKSLLELVGIEQEIEDAVGIKIDLLTGNSISPYILERIKKDRKVIWG